jgi:hypothetical protein
MSWFSVPIFYHDVVSYVVRFHDVVAIGYGEWIYKMEKGRTPSVVAELPPPWTHGLVTGRIPFLLSFTFYHNYLVEFLKTYLSTYCHVHLYSCHQLTCLIHPMAGTPPRSMMPLRDALVFCSQTFKN